MANTGRGIRGQASAIGLQSVVAHNRDGLGMLIVNRLDLNSDRDQRIIVRIFSDSLKLVAAGRAMCDMPRAKKPAN